MSNSLIVLKPQNWLAKDSEFTKFRDEQVKNLIQCKKNLSKDVDNYTGYDYGLMKGKKVLFHAGAEKLRQAGGLIPNFEITPLSGTNSFAIIVRCTLYKDDKAIAVGIGGGGSMTGHSVSGGFRGLDFEFNKGVQMARHRAFKSAIRIAYNIVDEYTQDIEEPIIKDAETKRVDTKIAMVSKIIEAMSKYTDFRKTTLISIAHSYDIEPDELRKQIAGTENQGQALQVKLLGLDIIGLKAIHKSIPKEVK